MENPLKNRMVTIIRISKLVIVIRQEENKPKTFYSGGRNI